MTVPDSPTQLPDERRAQVVELLRRRGVVRVNDLATELDVSAITVRRDIALLASQGIIRRVRGGAVLHGGALADTLAVKDPEGAPPRRRRLIRSPPARDSSRSGSSSRRSTTTGPT